MLSNSSKKLLLYWLSIALLDIAIILLTIGADRFSVIDGFDILNYHFPQKVFMAHWFRQGVVPLWNPLILGGTSFVGNYQSSMFYPTNLLYIFLPIQYALKLDIFFALLFAGIFMFALSKKICGKNESAFLSSILFMFSGFIISHLSEGHLAIVNSGIWCPAVFYFSLLALEKKQGIGDRGKGLGDNRGDRGQGIGDRKTQNPKSKPQSSINPKPYPLNPNPQPSTFSHQRSSTFYSILAGTVLGLQLLGGHPQLPVYTVISLFLFYIFRGGMNCLKTKNLYEMKRIFILFGITVFIGLAISSIQTFPFLENIKNSVRTTSGDFSWQGSSVEISKTYAVFLANVYKHGFSYETCAYIGVLPALMALFGIICNIRIYNKVNGAEAPHYVFKLFGIIYNIRIYNINTVFFTLLFVLSLLFAYGNNFFLLPLISKIIPIFTLFRAQGRFLFISTFALCVLAGIGLKRFAQIYAKMRHMEIQWKLNRDTIVLSREQACLFPTSFNESQRVSINHPRLSTAKKNLCGLGASVVKEFFSSEFILVILVILVISDLSVFISKNLHSTKFNFEPEISRIVSDLQKNSKKSFFRFFSYIPSLSGNGAMLYNIPGIEGYDAIINTRYREISQLAEKNADNEASDKILFTNPPQWFLNLMSVKYVIRAQSTEHRTQNTDSQHRGTEDFSNNQQLTTNNHFRYKGTKPSAISHQPSAVSNNQQPTTNNYLLQVFKNSQALPHIFIAGTKAQSSFIVDGLSSIDSKPSTINYYQTRMSDLPSTINYISPNEITLTAKTVKPAVLVITNLYDKGWNAYVNKRKTNIFRVNYILQGIHLPRGINNIRLIYSSVGFKMGLFLSSIMITIVIFYILKIGKG